LAAAKRSTLMVRVGRPEVCSTRTSAAPSVAYHLTKLGWSDVMLVERSELTSGST